MSSHNAKMTKFAIERTLENTPYVEDVIHFGKERVIDYGLFIPIRDLTYFDYNHLLLKCCYQFVKTDFMLHIQPDSMAMNRELWTDEYLKYDYIGAPWIDERVGNGGFSLRSAKLLDACRDANVKMPYVIEEKQHINEDTVICKFDREYLDVFHKIKIAPFQLAKVFSREMRDYEGSTFGFHGTWNLPLFFQKEVVEELMQGYYDYSETRKMTWNAYIEDVYKIGFEEAFKKLKEKAINDNLHRTNV